MKNGNNANIKHLYMVFIVEEFSLNFLLQDPSCTTPSLPSPKMDYLPSRAAAGSGLEIIEASLR